MKLKQLRTAQGLTQDALAKKAHLTQVHIARLESGKYDPALSTLQKLAKALKVKVGELAE